jgi:hypothetical protein
MTEYGPAAEWATRTAVAGGVILLLGLAWAGRTRCPARRQLIAGFAVRGAVVAAILCLLPGWLRVNVAPFSREAEPTATAATQGEPLPVVAEDADDDPLEPEEWVAVAAAGVDPRPSPEPVESVSAPDSPPAPLPLPRRDVVGPLLLGVYFVVAAALVGQLAAGQLGLIRLTWAATPAPPRVLAALDALAAGRPRVLVSDRIESPVCFGLVRPVILLPWELARSASPAELRWVLAHELDHLARGDHRTVWWVGAARAVFFPVLWFWPLCRLLHLSQEYLADAAAAAVGGRPAEYAEFLVNLSDRPARVPSLASGVRAGRSDLFRRVTMLLNPTAGLGRRPSRGWGYLTAGGVLSAAVLLSGLTPAADDPKPEPDPVEVEVVVNGDDAKPVEVKGEIDPDDEKAKPDVRVVQADNKKAIADLKAKIKEAIKKGDTEEAEKLVEKLEKLLSGPTAMTPPGKPVPPPPPAPPAAPHGKRFEFRVPQGDWPFKFDGFGGPGADKMKEGMERGMKALREAIEKVDSPEAKEQMQKAMEAMQRAMSQSPLQLQEQMRDFQRMADEFRERRGADARPRAAWPAERGARLGVQLTRVPEAVLEQIDLPAGEGLLVAGVLPDSAAAKAGVKKNDVLVRFNSQPVPADEGKFAELVAKAGGTKAELVVLRKGKRQTIEVDLSAARPAEPKRTTEVRPFDGKRYRIEVPEAKDGVKFNRVQAQVNNDTFTINASADDLRYTIRGTIEDGKPVASSIRITGDGEPVTATSLEKVPEKHRAAVQKLLGSVSRTK